MELDLAYPSILKHFGRHLVEGRLESRAFLGWFLEHFYRLDSVEAQDAICDGPDDKGIDGIYIDANLERVDVFQTKLYQKTTKTLGDTALKEFAGTLDQLRTRERAENLAKETGNLELRALLRSGEVGKLVEGGYELRGIFVTNVPQNVDATNYLGSRTDLTLVDSKHLFDNWVPPGETAPVHAEITFQLDGMGVIEYETQNARVYMAPLLAGDLVELTGLESQELFAWNVRQTLGKTKVNKAIAESVNNPAEHKNFLLYHNGLTILANKAELSDNSLTIDDYTVVNGCQSLSTLYENRNMITDDLRLLTRIIELPLQEELANKITRHTNNQNSISARDLQSNSATQRRLQQEFRTNYGDEVAFEIKRGEIIGANKVITNEDAARTLLAFDLQQPWTCHQSYKLFDDLHSEIFARPEVTASRIVALDVLFHTVETSMKNVEDKLFANYTLTKYFILYLLRSALDTDKMGKKFAQDTQFVVEAIGLDGLSLLTSKIVDDLIIDLNAELLERSENDERIDYKRELKSPSAVRKIRAEIISSYTKVIRRGRSKSFSQELEAM